MDWCVNCLTHQHIYNLSSSPANNLEAFFMFPQVKNRQEGKAQGLTPQAGAITNRCRQHKLCLMLE